MPADIFTQREPDEVLAALQDAGFDDTEVRRPNRDTPRLVATGLRKWLSEFFPDTGHGDASPS
jgi:hypothetical protein